MPRLSVILPVRDGAPTLPAALESLLDQTFTDFEVLLFDDGSRDESGKIVERFASSDRRLRPLGGERVGLVRALERCATAASSPLLGRMDADDICHPQRLEEQVALLDSRPELDAVGCRVRRRRSPQAGTAPGRRAGSEPRRSALGIDALAPAGRGRLALGPEADQAFLRGAGLAGAERFYSDCIAQKIS